MRILLFFLTILNIGIVNAGVVMPKGCQPLPMKTESAWLKTKKPMLFLMNNTGTSDLWLIHPVQDPGASAGWNSKLEPGRWSAMMVDKDFELNCIESLPGHEQHVSCEQVLALCSYRSLKIDKSHGGSAWMAENMPARALLTELGRRGLEVPEDDRLD